MKTDGIKKRIECGNNLADKVAGYLNLRLQAQLNKASIVEDKELMIDYKCNKSKKTAQIKCRENQSDIIYEAKKFYLEGNCLKEIDGRDVRTKAFLYVCLTADKKKIIITETQEIKKIVHEEIEKLKIELCQVKEYEHECKALNNKAKKLSANKFGIQVWFKVDEGTDTKKYSKLLVFIPYQAVSDCFILNLKNYENIDDPTTWKKTQKGGTL